MKILHTADWHLGQRLCDFDRQEEHDHFLQWLLDTLKEEKVDALVVAGDVFDVHNPPNYARKQYYNFLRKAISYCNNIIITGGNHDSPRNLDAPKELLEYLQVHVVGGCPEDLKEEVIEVKDKNDNVIGVVAAVPFLQERDIRKAVAGESYKERVERTQKGIFNHYHTIAEYIAAKYDTSKLPIIATGHLFAAGSMTSDSEKDIHIGNQGKVTAETFSEMFDYVALGHIHKPQLVNKLEHIRYCGSPIPLSFTEYKDDKQALLIDFNEGKLSGIRVLPIPNYRKLLRVKGNMEKVTEKLLALDSFEGKPTTWLEVQIELETFEADLEHQVRQFVADKNAEVLITRTEYKHRIKGLDEEMGNVSLDDLKPMEVFLKRCDSRNVGGKQQKELVNTFNELLEWMEEEKD
ncbi:MAG: exonuclease SbcCD subunit D C-terminal domain-containing protein [Chitinophagales bacterium]